MSLAVRSSARVRSDHRYHWAPRMGRSCWAIMTSGALAPEMTGGTAMSWAQPPPGPGIASRVQAAPLGFALNSHSLARPLPLASVLKSPFFTTDGPLDAPTGSPNLSNNGVEPDTPRFPSSRLTAKEVRPKVRRRLNCSGPWLRY